MLGPSFFVFAFMYVFSFLVIFGFSEWFLLWMGLEINMMSFIILIYKRYEMKSIESCLKYFFVQSMGSGIFLLLFFYNSDMIYLFIDLIMMYKMGGGPFYFWFISVCEGIGWVSCLFLLSFQKILPLLIIMVISSIMLFMLILISLLIGVMGSFNQMNIKRLMSYSSVHHVGWMLLLMMSGDFKWMMYLFIYLLVMLSVFMYLSNFGMLNYLMLTKEKYKMIFMFSMLSMAGIPPFLGFFLKWYSLYYIMLINKMLLFMMIVFSVVMLYIYIRILYDIFMLIKYEMSWDIKNEEMVYKIDLMTFLGVVLSPFLLLLL